MHRKVRRVLDIIDRTLLVGDDAAEELWEILTALRGPDFEGTLEPDGRVSWSIKEDTTAVIRTAAFPRTARASCIDAIRIGASFAAPGRTLGKVSKCAVGASYSVGHFMSHINRAAAALDLPECPR